ncbi:MAG: AAA family ATPase [Spirochaetaceae bacterium]|nr:MAG: AAA family ATPase [Spirochaetaceae bacterium]
MNYTEELNPEQCRAVETIDGPVLIIAGAGSGKTRVITYRIANMLGHGIPQSSILALTFTNKAAHEMAGRVRELLGRKLPNLIVSTFHAFGVRILREQIHRLGYRDSFSIYDTHDQLSLLKQTAREIRFSLDSVDLYTTLAAFSRIKTGTADWDDQTLPLHTLYHQYQTHLRLYNAVDFDDLIQLPIAILSQFGEVADGYRRRFSYILVDEFQDTSRQQYRFLQLLGGRHRNVCVVGDDDQSIYSWRGADYRNLLQFERDFPDLQEITLERNYRSSNTILAAANGVISHNTNRKSKNLWSGSDGGSPVELYHPEDERAEATFICDRIKGMALKEGLKYHDVGVLIRANSLARALEEGFLAENIPYRISGGESFFQRKEIKDMISYMRLCANPDDDVSLLRIMNTPRRGIGLRTLEQLQELARARGISLFSAMHAALAAEDSPLSSRARDDLGGFVTLIDTYRPKLLSGRRMAETLSAMVTEIDYWSYLVSEHQRNEKVAKWKLRNIELFIDIVRSYERDPDTLDSGLFHFLNRITLQQRDNIDQDDEQGKVNLMTIHAAKGLEHEVVFVAGVEDGIIPHARALEEHERNIEEERRLFYVAITRARRRLFLTCCRQRKVMREVINCVPSPFLEEIPAGLIQISEVDIPVEHDEAADYFAMIKARFARSGV